MIEEVLQHFTIDYSFRVVFTRNAFRVDNRVLTSIFLAAGPGPHRVLVAIDSGVVQENRTIEGQIRQFAARNASTVHLAGDPVIIQGGERCKNTSSYVDQIHALIKDRGVCRHSFVLAIGGGAVLDAVGYAAATAHRGVRLIRMPSTVLAQNDAGIGVKNSINAFGRKNFLGTFVPPFAVVNDLDLLATLSERDMRGGLSEAVKVATIKDRSFLLWMHENREKLYRFDPDVLEHAVIRCAQLHLEHIRSGDPFELGSARPLDFGHWSAHGLEEISAGGLRHGEAVAVGVALDAVYAQRKGLITDSELNTVLETLHGVGFALYHESLCRLDVTQALARFREHLGGELCVTLPDGLGRKLEVHEIDQDLMKTSIDELKQMHDRFGA